MMSEGWEYSEEPVLAIHREWGLTPQRVQRRTRDAEAEVERLAHGICDALKFLPPPTKNAGTAVLRGLLKGTDHEGHSDDNWGQ